MAITEGTQPAAVTWTGAWTTAQTTASFTPEAGALLVALLSADVPTPGSGTGSITDSLGGTWTLLKRQNSTTANVAGLAEVWVRDSPGAALTVSATQVTGVAANGGQLTVRTLIGALPAASQNGATAGNIFDTGAVQVSVAAGTGNKVYGSAFNWTASTAMTVLGNTTSITAFADATNGDNWASFKSTGDTAGTAIYGYSTVTQGQIAAVEIKAAPVSSSAMMAQRHPDRRGRGRARQRLMPAGAAPAAVVVVQVPPQPPQTSRRGWLPRRRSSASQPVPTPVVAAPVTVWIPPPQTRNQPTPQPRRSTRSQPVPQVIVAILPVPVRRRALLPRRRGSQPQPVPPPVVIAVSPAPPVPNIPRGRTFWKPHPRTSRADPPWPIAVIAASPPPPVAVAPTRKRPPLFRRRGSQPQPVRVVVQLPAPPPARRRPFLPRRRGTTTQPVPVQVVLVQPVPPVPPIRRARRGIFPRFPRRSRLAQPTPLPPVGPPPITDANGRVVVIQTVTSTVDAGGTSGLAGVDQATSSTVAASPDGGATRVDPSSDGRAEVG